MTTALELQIQSLERENARLKGRTSNYVAEEDLMAHQENFLPSCISYPQWKLWHSIRPRSGKAGLCEDCTPEHQNERCLDGRCDHPEILFYVDEDGMIYGSQIPRNNEHAINIKVKSWNSTK